MKLKEINFNNIRDSGYSVISIGTTGNWETGFIGDVLRKIPKEYADMEVKDQREYFDTYVIELEIS